MGHGVRAALITSMVKTLSDSLARKNLSPGEFISRMNRRLHPLLQANDTFLFATACYLTIDTESGILEGAIAGHTIPLLLQKTEPHVSLLELADNQLGPALAITPDFSFPTFTFNINPGDTVLMYTDGICEAVNKDEIEFGEEHLINTIDQHRNRPLNELLPAIVQNVRQFSHSEKLGDDICLLGFTLNP